jgi:hypothetical protein
MWASMPHACALLFSCNGCSQEALTSDGLAEPVAGNHGVPQPALLGTAGVIRRTHP